jgi:hypothetical protein
MIKTAEDAYLAGRQAAMQKLASDGSNTALNVAALAAIPAGAHLGSKYNPNVKGLYEHAALELGVNRDQGEYVKGKIKSQREKLIRAKEHAKTLSRNKVYKGTVDLDRKILQMYERGLSRWEGERTGLANEFMAAKKNYKGKGYMDILRRNKGTAIGLGLGTALAGGLYLAGRPDEPDPNVGPFVESIADGTYYDEYEPVAKVGPSAFYTSPSHSAGYRLASKYGPAQVISNQERQRR